ncbi:hypothetical protein HYU95_05315 [Candidatus Daviesbacteria bacterium]|nr:hypothetical protein [Candidatus Daviesbacteria bacterium]
MGKSPESKSSEVESDSPKKIIFVRLSPDRIADYSAFYMGPKNATICVGVRENSLRVVSAPRGGLLGHIDLVAFAAPTQDYKAVRAVLRSDRTGNSTEHILEIFKPDTENNNGANLYSNLFNIDPEELLNKQDLTELCHKLGADRYILQV